LCLSSVAEHLQKMYVTLLSLFGRVKTVLSFRKSRVFSRTRFQFEDTLIMGTRSGWEGCSVVRV